MINANNAYFFLTGLYIGGYSNFFSKIVITGLVVHMVNKSIFTYQSFEPLYENISNILKPYISKVYKINPNSPRINIVG